MDEGFYAGEPRDEERVVQSTALFFFRLEPSGFPVYNRGIRSFVASQEQKGLWSLVEKISIKGRCLR